MCRRRNGRPRMAAGVQCLSSLLLLACAAPVLATADFETQSRQLQEEGYNCAEISKVPAPEQCTFVQQQCADSRIPYLVWYYCSVKQHGIFAQTAYMCVLLLVLPMLFTLLGDTAEMYFSPIMANISQSIPKMRPRFAGVTFVAIGNGAPDLSANISAIRNGEFLLSAGALTGAAMFVQCVVGSEVLRISEGGVKCGGATKRDVAIYLASVTLVLSAFANGSINRWFIAGAVLLYLLYAVWVFCGDEWHARGRPPATSVLHSLRQSVNQLPLHGLLGKGGESGAEATREGLLPWAAVEAAEAGGGDAPGRLPPAFLDSTTVGPSLSGGSRIARYSSRTYQHMVWADLAQEELPQGLLTLDLARSGSITLRSDRKRTVSSAVLNRRPLLGRDVGSYQAPTTVTPASTRAASPFVQLSQGALLTSPDTSSSFEPSSGIGRGGVAATLGGGDQRGVGDAWGAAAEWAEADEEGLEEDDKDSVASSRQDLPLTWWGRVRHELTIGSSEEWEEFDGMQRRFRRLSFPILLPMYIMLRCTIPFVDAASYSRLWLLVTMMCAPLGVLLYAEAYTWTALIIAVAVGAVLLATVTALTHGSDTLPDLAFTEDGFAFGPALFSILGFAMGVLWIDTLATEVVGMISLITSLARLPSSLAGLTLLAIGNSLGDYYADTAMARRGAFSTALTACVASPLFNMLISMALGFGSYFATHHVTSAAVTLRPEVTLGCAMLVIYNVALVCVGSACGGMLPRRFYLFARAWYGLYLLLACILGLRT